jgi:hypothetical protein
MEATKTKQTDTWTHYYYWRKIGTFIEGWVIKNASGYSTAWGMLEDAYYKAHGVILSAEVGDKHVDLCEAAEQLGCGKELYHMAINLFIKRK